MSADPTSATFKIEYWGDAEPTTQMLEDDLRRITGMVAEGYTSGEAGLDEDFAGRGWWSMENFADD